jgi:multisubunit Na+/H+ antiporter MnhG subunit
MRIKSYSRGELALDDKKISGIEGVVIGLLGLVIFVWDWLLFMAIEDIFYAILFAIAIAIGAYLLQTKREAPKLDMTSIYASSY